MILRGKAWKLGDNISTDLIAPGRLMHLRSNLPEYAKHVFEDLDPEFNKKISKGDFVVAGKNFGLGSSREHAPTIMKMAGVDAVLAKSFARIFFRNAINIGLPLIQCDISKIDENDELEIDLEKGNVHNKSKNIELIFHPFSPPMRKIISDGGLIPHIQKYGDFNF